MADISKCWNSKDCPRHPQCYRHTAPASDYQSYTPFYKPGQECEEFWDNKGCHSSGQAFSNNNTPKG